MQKAFSELSTLVRSVDNSRIVGEVSSVVGLTLTVAGLERAMGIGAVTLTGLVVYGVAAFLFGVLDRDTVKRLMRRQG